MDELLNRYCDMTRIGPDGREYTTSTRFIAVEPGILERIAAVAAPYLGPPPARLGVVYDDNTLVAAGDTVLRALAQAGRDCARLHLEVKPGHEIVVCDDATLDEVTAALAEAKVGAAVAVGSGTINDLTKMSAHRLGIPYVSVPTAPSNNGYTSAIAAILSDGVKTTQPCTPVSAVFADPGVLREAPYRMIASGIGDLYSKPVSNADWRLSARLRDSFYSPLVMELVEAGNDLLEGVAGKLPERDLDAVTQLTRAIMLSGLAMQAAGSSGPASGGEHLISHYLDMTAERDGEPHDFHGCQVAVGTVVTATLYARLRTLDPASIDVQSAVDRLLPWEEYAEILDGRFGTLAESISDHARGAYPTRAELADRLRRLVEEWDQIMPWVFETLRSPEDLAAELDSAQCPIRFEQIGVSHTRALRCVRHCKDIRNRYTILHLLWELGLLDDLGGEVIDGQYR